MLHDAARMTESLAPIAAPTASFDAAVAPAAGGATRTPRRPRKPRCEDCFFNRNGLCALVDKKPCPTFRPAHPDGLRPPQQLSFVFRQERRSEPFAFSPAQAWTG